MNAPRHRHVYGPVPSRRLGRSLGIDLVPYKTCTYDCVYCQLGRTPATTIDRRDYVPVGDVVDELRTALAHGDTPDYISLAGSGEPTLHAGIGTLIRAIKSMTEIPVAVLTNGALLWRADVRDALMEADLVLPSLDAGDEHLFQRVNRPHGGIVFDRMVDGLAEFTGRFTGEVWLEVFLLGGVTGTPAEVGKIAAIARRVAPCRIQLNTVTRPPAEAFAQPVRVSELLDLATLFDGDVDVVCDISQGRIPAGVLSPGTEEDILALIGRRPCTAADVAGGLDLPLPEVLKYLDRLVNAGSLEPRQMGERCYYTVKGRAPAEAAPESGH